MNRTKIEYLTHTWNPITGCKGIGCAVRKKCWARAMATRLRGRYGYSATDPFKPTFHPDKLEQPLQEAMSGIIGTCFMGDFFDYEVKADWQKQVLNIIKRASWHTFLILTKQPQKINQDIQFPKNLLIGTSVNTQSDTWRVRRLKGIIASKLVVSFEPLYEAIKVDLQGIDWIIIGAQSRPNLQPKAEWVEDLVTEARRVNAAIFIKNNVKTIPVSAHPQEWARVTERF